MTSLEQLKSEAREKAAEMYQDSNYKPSPELIDTLVTTAFNAGLERAVEICDDIRKEIPKSTREPFELAENVGKQMVLDDIKAQLQAEVNKDK